MKFIYKQQYKYIPNINFYLPDVKTLVSSRFESEDSKTELKITDPEIIMRNKDWIQANNDYLAGFFGNGVSTNSGYIGIWSEDLEQNANLYYINVDGKTTEFIISKYNELGFTNDLDGLDYFVHLDGKLMSALIEDGDIIYDNYEEAKQANK